MQIVTFRFARKEKIMCLKYPYNAYKKKLVFKKSYKSTLYTSFFSIIQREFRLHLWGRWKL